MGSVNNQALVDKLHNLNSTQQSIETVSAWCSFYRRDARKVVSIWEQEFVKISIAKQLAMLYLANDILQNSRKKGPEFVHEFYKTLPRAVKHMLKHGDDKVKRSVNRMVDIWEDRKVFGNSGTRPFRDLAAEAETPKRTSSGVSQQAEAGIPAKFQALEPLANALSEARSASLKSENLTQMVLHLDEGMVSTGTPSELLAAGQLLKQYHSSLQAQLSRHQHAAHILQAMLGEQEESAQTAQQQLDGTQQQQQLVQERLRHSSAPAQQAQPSPSAHTGNHAYAQPAAYQQARDQAHNQPQNSHDQAYLNGQTYPSAQEQQDEQEPEADMDFEPPGSARGDPSEDPFAWEGGPDRPENGQDPQEAQQQEQPQDELYTPGLPAEPSGDYMADPSLQLNGAAFADAGSKGDITDGPAEEAVPSNALSGVLAAFQGLSKEQMHAIGLNLEAYHQPAASDPNEFLADQITNSSKAAEEYDPEDLYDPSENM